MKLLSAAILTIITANTCLADPEWPQWRGPQRDGISTETGLLKQWPDAGPKLLWTATGCGKGYSSMAVTKDTIYTAGTSATQSFVIAFDLAGNEKWKAPNGEPWSASEQMNWARGYDGSRATPTVDDGVVYHLNGRGALSAFNAEDGKTIWSINVMKKFEADCPKYGYSESVLIDGDRLICCPAGVKGFMVALNKKTGAVEWVNTEIADTAGFSSIVIGEYGPRQYITLTGAAVISVNAKTGKLLWSYPFTNKRQNNIPTPICTSSGIFAASGYGTGSVFLRPTVNGEQVSVELLWKNDELDNIHGGVVMVDGHFYGASNNKPAWLCVDASSGTTKYRSKELGMGSVTVADGMLYCLAENGIMALVPCTPEEYKVVGRFNVPKGGDGKYWAHPVVCGARLYLRHADNLYAYDIKPQ